MKLSEIEAVATMTCGLFITGEKDVCLDWNESEKAQEIIREEQEDMSIGEIQGLYTSEQMQDYANECVRAALKEYVGPYSDKKANSIISRVVK
ncbi:Phage protein [Lactococcus lactis subsp. lactis]|uniref:hypothetical protein n=1 Tax=Lactococcus lactis TaxID=1358 RepID=UPI00071D9115|nr:hypothetical protein [Lactococcus lactis]KSU12977.1 Phage protein [Lactococcus lactis subsp. lactis]